MLRSASAGKEAVKSRNEVGGGEGDEFAGGDDFGLFPEWGEVAGVAGDEVVGRAASAHSRKMLSAGSEAAAIRREG